MDTLCCSLNCERKYECARHSFNNEGTHYVEDFYSFGSGNISIEGCTVNHWCGEKGNWRMFEQIKSMSFVMDKLTMQNKLESLKKDFEDKWIPRRKKCNEDTHKFFEKNKKEIFDDMFPIMELSFTINFLEGLE